MPWKSFVFMVCLGFTIHANAQIEPQFKFYLAFEDVHGLTDTVWFGIDDSASTTEYDTAFGDTLVEHINGTSQTWFYQTGNYALKTFIYGSSQTSWNIDINADWPEYPIILRWDTSLLTHHDLSFELKQIYIYNDYFYSIGYPDGYDLIQSGKPDSIILEKFQISGGDGQHFPLQLYLSKEPKRLGLEHHGKSISKIFPNPANSTVHLNRSDENWPITFEVFNQQSCMVQKARLVKSSSTLDVHHLSEGIYFIRFKSEHDTWTEKLVLD